MIKESHQESGKMYILCHKGEPLSEGCAFQSSPSFSNNRYSFYYNLE